MEFMLLLLRMVDTEYPVDSSGACDNGLGLLFIVPEGVNMNGLVEI